MFSITYMGKIMKSLMVGKAKALLHTSIGKGPLSGITSGAVMTVLVQSSSTTTSLMVPLVGSGILKAKDIYPFTLGANIGTCITALIAALGVVGVNSGFALQIALVHLIYNVLGVTLIYGLPLLRNIPLNLSYQLCYAYLRAAFIAQYSAQFVLSIISDSGRAENVRRSLYRWLILYYAFGYYLHHYVANVARHSIFCMHKKTALMSSVPFFFFNLAHFLECVFC